MSNQTSISIITPVWNGLPYIKECIESVLSQEFTDWELLISDNGSTDGTREYLYSLDDPRIRVFMQEVNLGIMNNLNFLFANATAPISQILCADDYLTGPRSLNVITNYWNNAPANLGFVRFSHNEPSTCHILNLEQKIAPLLIHPNESALWFFVFGNIPGNLSNVSLKTNLVNEVGGFDPNFPFAGDFEFWSKAARKATMGVQKESVIYVRRHEGVASNYLSLKGELYTQHIAIYEQLIDQLAAKYNRRRLVSYFNIEVCSFHLRNAIKASLHGQFGYLKQMLKVRSDIVWPKWVQLIALFPFVVFNGKQRLTVLIAQKLIDDFYENQHVFTYIL